MSVTTRYRMLDVEETPDFNPEELKMVKKKLTWQGLVTDKKRAIDPREIYEWLQPGVFVIMECSLRVLAIRGEMVSTLRTCRTIETNML